MSLVDSALLTDLYQLTMLQGYFHEDMNETAVFELFVRKMPPERNFFVAAGTEQLLEFLETFEITAEECAWLSSTERFDPDFIDYLKGLKFSGNVDALPEGTVFFPNEPIVKVSAPMPEAQIIETRLINLIQFQTLIASKAVRCVLAAPDKMLVDFGLRRAHGAEAGLMAARASYIAGYSGSSNVLAAKVFDIPMYGTMAHSYVMAHDDEATAFEQFAHSQPDNVVLLIDTYDTETAAKKVVEMAPMIKQVGAEIKAIRLDSGDLIQLSQKVRSILDLGGLTDTRIFASGDLDEYELQRLLAAAAPIDGFGIGTRMITSSDRPYLNCAYKLQVYAGKPRRKYSEGKVTWPGSKQVYRQFDQYGLMEQDVLTLEENTLDGDPLLLPVMREGRRVSPSESLPAIRQRVSDQLNCLPLRLKQLEKAAPYPVIISDALQVLAANMTASSAKVKII